MQPVARNPDKLEFDVRSISSLTFNIPFICELIPQLRTDLYGFPRWIFRSRKTSAVGPG
jgi:hypothetical protein